VLPRMVQPLEVYTKGQGDKEWVFAAPIVRYPPPSGSAKRPISAFNIEWGSNARRSVVIADGAGGFLPVPSIPLPPTPGEEHEDRQLGHSKNVSPWIGGESEPAATPKTWVSGERATGSWGRS
jgi:hypothetical protein